MGTESTLSSLAIHAQAVAEPVAVARPIGTIICLLGADLTALNLSLFLGLLTRRLIVGSATLPVADLAFAAFVFTISSFLAARLYPGVCENPVDELARIVRASTLSFLCLGAASFISHDLSPSRLIVLFAYLYSLVLVPLARAGAREAFAAKSWWGSPVVLLGMGETGKRVLKTLREHPKNGLKPVAILDDDPESYEGCDDGLINGPLSRCLEITRANRVSYGIICMPSLSREELFALLDRYGDCFSDILVIPDLVGIASVGIGVRELGGVVGLEVAQKLLRPFSRSLKRSLDLAFTIALAPLVLPIVALAALLVKLDSPGPIFYRDVRIGFRGQPFVAWKLRSMVVDGENALKNYLDCHPDEWETWIKTQKLKRDPRITRVGRVIRRASIDELPQFWNVLVGQMSVVGPRPFLPSQMEMYGPAFELYKRVRPGITGLWQISGRNHLTFKERAKLDAHSIKNWSVWLDLYILARTVSAVITAKGAY
jgi:Undecaprenyl-phosphate galactose phosphotransferase WbaP